ncbi:MAG: hypothetical protein NC489_37575, partial [Ruminococcus flavefaciens]|nr:hypothetical protein [Ruminococcus flavefaciens]
GGGYMHGADLALVAQGYYGSAFIVKKTFPGTNNETERNMFWKNVILFLLAVVVMCVMKTYLGGQCIMDLANHAINNIWWSTIAVVNGIILLSSLSKVAGCFKGKVLQEIFELVGKNTMGIMLLHFSFFRLVSFFLYKLGIAPIDICRNLVPSQEFGNRFWAVYVIVAVIGSVSVWAVFAKIPMLAQLLGLNKSFMKKIPDIQPCRQIIELYNTMVDIFVNAWNNYMQYIKLSKRKTILYVMVSVGIIAILAGSKFVPSSVEISSIGGMVTVEFPYNGTSVRFGDGWLPQTDGENYRWVAQESEFGICLEDQNKIHLTGYVPDGIEGISRLELYMNGNLIAMCDIREGEPIDIEADFSAYKSEDESIFKITFDSIRIPGPDDADRRSFSAMFTSILIE